MKTITFHGIILLTILFAIAFFYGDFGSQILAEQSTEKGYNAVFQVALAIFALIYIYRYKIRIDLPYKTLFIFYLVFLFLLSFTRSNLIEDLRLCVSIALTQFIILFISSLMHKLRFNDALFLLTTYFVMILGICVFVHLNNVGNISFVERDMYNRLGGLYFYGVTGTLAGLTAILSGIGFYVEKSFRRKSLYVCFLIVGLLLTLGADLRNAMAASGLCIIYLFYRLSKRNLSMKFVLLLSIIAICFMGYFYMKNSEAATSTDKDLDTREMIWTWSFSGISKKPLNGYGKVNYFASNVDSMMFSEQLSDPHSSILNLMLTQGIPAAILFFLFYSKIVIFYYKYDKLLRGILVIIPLYWLLATITGGAFFIGNGYYGSYMFGLSMFGILLHPQLINT